MFDEANYDVHPMINNAIPPQEKAPEVQEQPVVKEEIVQQAQQKESDKEKNLRILRERAEKAERERDELMRQALEKQQQAFGPKQVADVLEEEINLGNDDIVEGKHLSKVQKEIKKLKEELNQYKQQSSTQTAETRLKAQYADFDTVVTRDNIELLSHSYPELAQTLRNAPDLYTQGSAAYTLIKKFIDQPESIESQQAEKNIYKPRPSNSISPQQGDTPLSRVNAFANGLTEDLKAQLIREMNEYRKGY